MRTTVAAGIQRRFAAGETDVVMAAGMGLMQGTIAVYRQQLGLRRIALVRYKEPLTLSIPRLRQQGRSITEIADELKVTVGAVIGALQRHRAKRVEPVRNYEAWIADFAHLSLRAIAMKYSVKVAEVRCVIYAAGLDTRKHALPSYTPACSHDSGKHRGRRRGLCWRCYRQQYPEEARTAVQRRYARKLGASGQYTTVEWLAVLQRYANRCAYCGGCALLLHRDHVVPLSRSGTNDVTNIVPACPRCNQQKNIRVWTPWPPERILDGSAEHFGPIRIAYPLLTMI